MTFIEAVEKAMSVGYVPHSKWRSLEYYEYKILLDQEFFKALGKAMGWNSLNMDYVKDIDVGKIIEPNEWRGYWHSFIDHLAEGKDAESYFKQL